MTEERYKCRAMCSIIPAEVDALCDIQNITWEQLLQKKIDAIIEQKEGDIMHDGHRVCNVEDKQNIKSDMHKHYINDKLYEYRYSVTFDIPLENVLNGRVII